MEHPPQMRAVIVNKRFVEWLDGNIGRAQHFSKVDAFLSPPMISKMKKGELPISFETALRLERAQKPGPDRITAEEMMSYKEDIALLRYVRGQEPAPTTTTANGSGRKRRPPLLE